MSATLRHYQQMLTLSDRLLWAEGLMFDNSYICLLQRSPGGSAGDGWFESNQNAIAALSITDVGQ